MSKNRQSNFELLRIILMVAVPLYHMMIYAGIIYMPYGDLTPTALFICSGSAIVADYAFMAMSAFFLLNKQSKNAFSKVFELGVQVFVLFLFKIFIIRRVLKFPENDYYVNDFFVKGAWWFIYVYLIILIMYPILNYMISQMKLFHMRMICICLGGIFVWNGIRNDVNFLNDIIAFLFTYILIAYLKRTDFKTYFGLKITKRNMFAIYITGFFLTFVFLLWVKFPGNLTSESLASDIVRCVVGKYSFIEYIMGIAMFLLFKLIDIKTNKVINYLARNVFYVFLLHETVMAIYWYFGKMRTIDNVFPYKTPLEILIWSVIYIGSSFLFAWIVRLIYENTFGKLMKIFEV